MDRIENPEVKSYIYGQLIFDKCAKTIQQGKNSLFNKWCWGNWISTCKRMKLDPYFKSYTKINSNWIKDLIIRGKTIKLLEENTGVKLCDFEFGSGCLNTKSTTKEKIN